MAGSLRERSPGRRELRVFIGRDPVTGRPIQITRTYSADRKEPGAGRRAVEKKLAALVASVERGKDGRGRSDLWEPPGRMDGPLRADGA